MQKFTPLFCRFIKELAAISNIKKKSDLAIFQSAPYPRIRRMLIDILKQFLPIFFLIDLKNKVNGCALLFEKFHCDLTLNIL